VFNAQEILDEAGTKTIISAPQAPTGFGSHEAGTVRTGKNLRTSVLRSYSPAHEVKNLFVVVGSAFTTYPEKKPSLTIMALAARTVRFVAAEVTRRNLKT
jgi:choline dehydrogenase-like flavoprotein